MRDESGVGTPGTASPPRGRFAFMPAAPPVPSELEDTGLDASFVVDLMLKTIYRGGAQSGRQLAERTHLPFGLLDGLLLDLQQRHLLEVRRTDGHGRRGYVFDLTTEGRTRARDSLASNRYVGPAPVPFESYAAWVRRQSTSETTVSPARIRRALSGLVLDDTLIDAVGAAVNSGGSLFLHGSPGNGKTALSRALLSLFDSPVFVPRSVAVEGGTILKVHDPLFHEPAGSSDGDAGRDPDGGGNGARSVLEAPPSHDRRFALVKRPVVTVGGELALDDLDLQEDLQAGLYRAPVQLKANGGVLLIDDFGRQRIPPRDLLNRWMIPLEEKRDYLALPTGHKLPVPFDCFLIFATNLEPTDLVEEAFLRRLRYKVAVGDPTREQYETIFQRCCDDRGLEFSPAATELIFREYYGEAGIQPRGCHPRDLVAHLCDEARYRGVQPFVTPAAVERACRSYFLAPGPDDHTSGPGADSPGRS